jgi:hypothetical protein
LKIEDENRNSSRSPKGREARDAAIGLFVKATLSETRATEAAKMARLRALRLAKEVSDKESTPANRKSGSKPLRGSAG